MRKTLAAGAAALAFAALTAPLAAPARAADPMAHGSPVGTITISATSAAAGVGYTWGDGVLRYHGHSYHFSVKGVSVADVGYAKILGHGRVYNLKNIADFSGTYAAATGEATLVNGIGGQYLRNANGVEIRVDQVTRGARLTGSADGIQLEIAH
jgi:hypothetical protein